ncbi:hypothetical protein [Actinocorallia populi]|uniref:hypothetical protein n=1 Tax=Actinocorallia populi TaxID=2079200 RepID=UPI000D08AECC|nr:hypothetical protein [Actinocorallia populi]
MTEQNTEKEPEHEPLMARLAPIISVVAPTTLVTALLLYFGYLATRARFNYFGAPLDLVNPSSTDLLFYGSEAVFKAILTLALATLVGVGLYLVGRWLIADPRRDAVTGWISLALFYTGLVMLAIVLVVVFHTHTPLTNRPLETPVLLMLSALALRYGLWLWQARAERRGRARWLPPEAVDIIRATLLILLIAGLFWTCNLAAALYGRNRGVETARTLPLHPKVVLYTQDAIDSLPREVDHTDLGEGRKFRHRYGDLHLLVESDRRLFLVPVPWSPRNGRVLVVENSADIRLQLIPPEKTRRGG